MHSWEIEDGRKCNVQRHVENSVDGHSFPDLALLLWRHASLGIYTNGRLQLQPCSTKRQVVNFIKTINAVRLKKFKVYVLVNFRRHKAFAVFRCSQ